MWVVEQGEAYKNSYNNSHLYTYKVLHWRSPAEHLHCDLFLPPTRNLDIHFRAPDIKKSKMSFSSLPIEILPTYLTLSTNRMPKCH